MICLLLLKTLATIKASSYYVFVHIVNSQLTEEFLANYQRAYIKLKKTVSPGKIRDSVIEMFKSDNHSVTGKAFLLLVYIMTYRNQFIKVEKYHNSRHKVFMDFSARYDKITDFNSLQIDGKEFYQNFADKDDRQNINFEELLVKYEKKVDKNCRDFSVDKLNSLENQINKLCLMI